ncbi:MAG: UMP kinase [Planctomycetaceae bacterium]|nr:UMP kinase [Planctomycetaceae bacterium]
MADPFRYTRVLLKISGESLCQPGCGGIDAAAVAAVADELSALAARGVQIALVIGGGNILRGRDLTANPHVQRPTADYMGMLATVINALALHDTLVSRGAACHVMSAIPMVSVCDAYTIRAASASLAAGKIVILAGGTGSPFFTTDTCAALRASELGAEVLIKATKVDGVFDADPVKNPAARKYSTLTYGKVLADKLGVMDLTAISLCMENRIPILVFQLSRQGNLLAAVSGQDVGTVISE